MTHEKYFVAGVARNSAGQLKARYSTLTVAETIERQEKAGNTDICYVELPTAMSRQEIPAYLLTLDLFSNNTQFKAVLEAANTNHVLKNKAPRPKVSKIPAVKVHKTVNQPKIKKLKDEPEDLVIEELKIIAA